MTTIHQLPTDQASYDQASDWIVKLDRGLTPDEELALQEWLVAGPNNQATLTEMTQLWDKMDAMSRLADIFAKPTAEKPAWQAYSAIAASFILVALIGLWALFGGVGPATPDRGTIYQTAIGEQSSIMLPDGTQVVLNTNSQLEVIYTQQARLLQLHRGELHISVAKDQNRPLTVIAAGKMVQAVGTEFNIEITDRQKIELVVTEGKVKVGVQQAPQKLLANSQTLTSNADAPTVSAGEEMLLGQAQEQITQVSPEEIAVKLSWRTGNLIFRGEPLEEAVKEIGRYTSVEFVFMSEDLKKVRVAGLFKAGDVQGLLATLRENFDIISHKDSDGKVRLSPAKKATK